ncbi:unnamed protein product, partial [Prunus brigantina]
RHRFVRPPFEAALVPKPPAGLPLPTPAKPRRLPPWFRRKNRRNRPVFRGVFSGVVLRHPATISDE